MKKLRLLLWETCGRSCDGCCNKDWDLSALPIVTEDMLRSQDIVMLTGGEPLLFVNELHCIIRWIRKSCNAEIYVYSAKVNDLEMAVSVMAASDGMCVTLHEQSDVRPFLDFAVACDAARRSKRVNVFSGVSLEYVPEGWKCKDKIAWIPNCPLPDGETFARLLR